MLSLLTTMRCPLPGATHSFIQQESSQTTYPALSGIMRRYLQSLMRSNDLTVVSRPLFYFKYAGYKLEKLITNFSLEDRFIGLGGARKQTSFTTSGSGKRLRAPEVRAGGLNA